MKRYKRRALRLIYAICASVALIFCCCDGVTKIVEKHQVYDGFFVTYIDVGEGDATFIRFSDGKTMLIDCGEKSDENMESVRYYLKDYCKSGLDYFMITHPDSDHVGNAADILKEYDVKTAFVPDLRYPDIFREYYAFYSLALEKETEIITSQLYRNVIGEDYFFVLLSPNPKGVTDSSYTALNDSAEPTAKERNNVSPIVYLEYKGVKFVFTGDADTSQEKVAIDNVNLGFVNAFLDEEHTVDLKNVDFLKVGHHGSDDSTGKEFLTCLTPKYAIISVGADNRYGHPNTATLLRISENAPLCKVLRTSLSGDITVTVKDDGEVGIITSSDNVN